MSQALLHIPHAVDSPCRRKGSLLAQWIDTGVDIHIYPLLTKLELLDAVELLSEPTRDLLRALDGAVRDAGKNDDAKSPTEFALARLIRALGEVGGILEEPPRTLRKRLRVPTGPILAARDIIERAAEVSSHLKCSRIARVDYFS